MNYYSGNITKERNDGKTIFVFGSNLAGYHGAGAALTAYMSWGAIYYQGIGPQRCSYAIPTKDQNVRTLPLSSINHHVEQFKKYAQEHPEFLFYVTPIGCGLAGYKNTDIAPMFNNCSENVFLPIVWCSILEPLEA